MQVNKFKILCKTGVAYWHVMEAEYNTISEAEEKAKKYQWQTAIVLVKKKFVNVCKNSRCADYHKDAERFCSNGCAYHYEQYLESLKNES